MKLIRFQDFFYAYMNISNINIFNLNILFQI